MSKLTLDEILDAIVSLPVNEFNEVVKTYSSHTGSDYNKELKTITCLNLQQRLDILGINSSCPKCGSVSILKKGKRSNGIKRLQCKDCNTKFTPFTGTILEKTNYHWSAWIKVLEMTINNYPLTAMKNVLENDLGYKGINKNTVWLWRMKLIYALASMPMPKLSGIVQIDETFIRESQKASKNLVSYIDSDTDRNPRYGYSPSKYGIMGSEFANITVAVSNTGHSVAKVIGLGRLTNEIFIDLFEDHLDNPAFICSDANPVYKEYCRLKNIPHCVRPSNYSDIIKNNGYVQAHGNHAIKKNNERILERLFYNEISDKILNRGDIDYKEFSELKETNKLSLGQVNQLHSDIKHYINGNMKNVGTKHLQDYIGFFTYIRNWRVDKGHYPTSSKDAEDIFIEILKSKVNYVVKEIREKELDLPKPSSRYMTLLKQETETARKTTKNKYFKFNEEDGVISFNKREFLTAQPKFVITQLCKDLKIKGYTKLPNYSRITYILKQPNIKEIIYKLIADRHTADIEEEDLLAIKAGRHKKP